jgi:hypothetical protein
MGRVTASRQLWSSLRTWERKPQDGRDRAKDPVAVLDAVFVEGVVDTGRGQDIGEREAVVTREASAELLQACPGVGSGVSGRADRDELGRVELASVHTLYYDAEWTKVH